MVGHDFPVQVHCQKSTTIPPHYDYMLSVISLLFTLVGISCSSLHIRTVGSSFFPYAPLKFVKCYWSE